MPVHTVATPSPSVTCCRDSPQSHDTYTWVVNFDEQLWPASAIGGNDAVTLRMWTAPRDLPTSCGPTAKRLMKKEVIARRNSRPRRGR